MAGFGVPPWTENSPHIEAVTSIITETARPIVLSTEIVSLIGSTVTLSETEQSQTQAKTTTKSVQSVQSAQPVQSQPVQSPPLVQSQPAQSGTTQSSAASLQASSSRSSNVRTSQSVKSRTTQQWSSTATPHVSTTFQTTFQPTKVLTTPPYSSSYLDITRESIVPVLLNSMSFLLPGASQITSSIPDNFKSSSIRQTTASPTSSSSASSFAPTTTSSIATPIGTIAGDSTSAKSKTGSTHIGAIVGGSVSGAACIAFFLLLCLMFIRRRRRTPDHKRHNSLQRLMRKESISSIPSFLDHSSHDRKPSLPIRSLSEEIPSAPFFSTQRRYPHPANIHMHPALSPSVSLDRISPTRNDMYGFSTNPSVDAVHDPPSPIIHISPPSRSASIHSYSSWEDAILDHYETPSPSILSIPHHPSQSTLNLPGYSFEGSQYLGTPPIEDSRHSNPFDLEPPPHALHKGEPLPPHPLAQGLSF
ncbi:hypothetical protein N7495_008816 [Penicillium taxi]|uniref:uncharacterized protein n=1 Tax=Penicillium taxi TaxID=168475 RepID=UPI00254590BB|nr:uncharacterized protein N7495_008816 [Penicillium taxi]KAJ5888775.1 hypothetical protein N7495_008816 [Penicillium taxi]